jgi:hypothetical protein
MVLTQIEINEFKFEVLMFVNLDVLLLLGFPAYFKPQLIGHATIPTKRPNGLIVLPRAPFSTSGAP